MWTHLLRGHAICALATFFTIMFSQAFALGAFATANMLVAACLALGLTVFASVAFWGVAIVLHLLGVEKPGFALHTVTTSLMGAAAVIIGNLYFPAIVLVDTIGGALLTGFANTMLIWLIALFAGSTQKDLTFWPQFRR